jgi:hypothetical protein
MKMSRTAKALLLSGGVLNVALVAVVLPWPHPRRVSRGCETQTWEYSHDLIAYLYALHLEAKRVQDPPHSRADLERQLRFYSMRTIVPQESCWGRNYELEPRDSMVQYLILWHAPLDVVYDAHQGVKAIFTSYE